MEISIKVKSIIKRHSTNNPFIIANEKNIIVVFEPLGKYRGYYNKVFRQKFIHINENLGEIQQRITCAHELGHSLLNTNINTPFMRCNTLYSLNKYERQANIFASHLLIPDDFLNENLDTDIFRLAKTLELPVELVKLRLNIL